MASPYRVRGLGMDRELEKKIAEKYSLEDENEIMEWIVTVLSNPSPSPYLTYPEAEGPLAFQNWLKDGTILCALINRLAGEPLVTEKRINDREKISKIKLAAMKAIKEQENIGMFLKAIERYGLKTEDTFQTVSLYEGRNLPQVQATLFKLGAQAQANGYEGPAIGVKESKKNARHFDKEKLNEGKNIIGLQMGTNQVASQQGMTPYGLGRQLVSSPNGGCR